MADPKPLNPQQLQSLVEQLAAATKVRTRAKRLVDALELKGDRVHFSLSVADAREQEKDSYTFNVVDAFAYGHAAHVIKGRELVHAHLRRFALDQLIAATSKVEGLEFQIRRLTNG